ncbi:uncharacterized protein ASCRUDRAFT_78030 [Ascoidea rubescens DSM 1968]|uniref:Uncharacterized protein n=1 Tax=Ascoidea rubescens DSM 1968 TaxID=1344418 RepID=A0A1D2VA94_9ASCO|nr:hypothetical protein ASCRUDRAFT_78030 [Ascoidea rubescens DSM 1968]ODV58343.1 hypothetical protein ASCRUDRAFT_78030 [Ascoidea rubescens DSM 1968]
MSILEAPCVSASSAITTISTYCFEHLGLKSPGNLRFNNSNVIPLTTAPTVYYVRRDRKNRHRSVNVFDSLGNKIYVFERGSPLNPVWALRKLPSRQEVATVKAGFFSTTTDFHNQANLQHRDVKSGWSLSSGTHKSFYLNDGYEYQWNNGTKFLEKISSKDAGDEEVRERIAKARLMRQFKFDFELIFDSEKINPEVVLSTSFISMLTQWGVGENTETRGPTYVPPDN